VRRERWIAPAMFAQAQWRLMSRIVGIDLGTTNSLVATVDSGIPLVIADADGQRLTPSVVYYPGPVEPPVAGRQASRARVLYPAQTVYSIKRFMGRRGSEIPREEMLVTYPVRGTGAGAVSVDLHGTPHSPEAISSEILKKLKGDAETFFGEPVTRAVITVPAYFNDAQRNATKRAGELAGFTVERILNEPTAAALAYGLDRLQEQSRIAVYDLGGGTFDLSILELKDGVFQVLATNGNTRLGGDDLDRRIVEFLLREIRQGDGTMLPEDLLERPPTRLSAEELSILARLRETAEHAKIQLSTETEVEMALPFLVGQFSYQRKFTRAELEQLTLDIIERTRPHCLRSLADAQLEPSQLDQVILVGGQTRMPLVRRLVGEWFGCVDFAETRGNIRLGDSFHAAKGPQLNTSQNPDEAVALGAAIQAEILSGGLRNLLLLDVTPLSLGLETFGGLMNVLIPRNTTVPVKAGEAFTTAVDHQREMLIHVLQGERERAKDNWSLGQFTLDFEPAPRGVARVGVQFEIDANGILHVLARDLATGRQKIVAMRSAVDVDDADVQRMVEESVEHFFDDTRARQWIESKLKAIETAGATRHALTECGEELAPGQRDQIEKLLADVARLLAEEDAGTKTGDPRALKAAVTALDEATKPLADLLMDKAMDAMLRQRGLIT
jgi:molecular chaperone DnaK